MQEATHAEVGGQVGDARHDLGSTLGAAERAALAEHALGGVEGLEQPVETPAVERVLTRQVLVGVVQRLQADGALEQLAHGTRHLADERHHQLLEFCLERLTQRHPAAVAVQLAVLGVVQTQDLEVLARGAAPKQASAAGACVRLYVLHFHAVFYTTAHFGAVTRVN